MRKAFAQVAGVRKLRALRPFGVHAHYCANTRPDEKTHSGGSRQRVARKPEQRDPVLQQRKQGGLAGAHGNTVKDNLRSQLSDGLPQNVMPSGRRGTAGQQDPGPRFAGFPDRARKPARIIRNVTRQGYGESPLGAPGRQPGGVDVEYFSGRKRGAARAQFVARGQQRQRRRRAHAQLAYAGGRQMRDMPRAQPFSPVIEPGAGGIFLALDPQVAPLPHRLAQAQEFGAVTAGHRCMFPGKHGVQRWRHEGAGVHAHDASRTRNGRLRRGARFQVAHDPQFHRRVPGPGVGVFRSHGKSIHRRIVERRRRHTARDFFNRNGSQRIAHGQPPRRRRPAGAGDGCQRVRVGNRIHPEGNLAPPEARAARLRGSAARAPPGQPPLPCPARSRAAGWR